MKIATFNVNSIGARLPRLLEWLAESRPDVACLQETKTVDDKFPALELQAAGYEALWHGQKSYNGVAILARGVRPRELQRGLPGLPGAEGPPDGPEPGEPDLQARFLQAEVGGTVVACLYLPNGNPQPGPKFDYKLAWFERLAAHAAPLLADPRPVLLAGDWNVVPTDAKADIYDTRSYKDDALLQPAPRAAYRRLLDAGWQDAIATLHPGVPMYTFWDYFRNRWARDAGLRIDHLLLNPAAAARLRAAGVDKAVRGREKASDHAPAWVDLAG